MDVPQPKTGSLLPCVGAGLEPGTLFRRLILIEAEFITDFLRRFIELSGYANPKSASPTS